METVLITGICCWAGVQVVKVICFAVLASQRYATETEHIEAQEGGIPPVKE